MDITKRFSALAVVPVLVLFAAVALADVSGRPDDSLNATAITEGAQIKNRGQCNGATFFKNAFPSLTNGTPGGSTTIDFTVDGKIVPMTVTWFENNSFDFVIKGGWASRVGVTVDKNNFIYEYANPTVGVSDPAIGFEDKELNFYGGLTADDVNHLDLCLETLDTTAPTVGIRVEPSTDGIVFGTVSIIATVTDESPVNVTIEIVSADGTQTITVCDPNDPNCADLLGPTISGNEYTWTWDTSTVFPGEYIIKVTAADTSALANVTTESLTVTVVTAAQNCLEGNDEVPPGSIGIGGCNPSGFQIVELPNELDGLLDGKTLTQVAAPAVLQTDRCGGPAVNGVRPFEFVGRDPRVNEVTGVVEQQRPLDLTEVFDLSDFFPPNTDPTGEVVMRADTVGSPCLVLIFGDANFSFAEFYDPNNGAPLQNSGAYTYTVTQLPQEAGLVPFSGVGPLSPNQTNLQLVPQATYQPDDRFSEPFVEREASPFTNDVFNPQRKKTPEFSWFVLGTLEVCLFLDPALPQAEAILQCKTDLAIEYFDSLEVVLNLSGPYLISPSLNNLLTDLNKARSMVKVGFWDKAEQDLTALLNQVVGGIWTVNEFNYPGNIVMRIENLLWRVRQLEEAELYLP